MAVVTKTTNDNGGVIAPGFKEQTRPELITFGGAATLLAGCILARDSVSLKLVPFVKGGSTNQNGIPKAVLLYPVTAAGAGDVMSDALIMGGVRKERLVINADGNDSNIDAAVIDQLRAFGITPVTTQQLAVLDP
jgi:Bacteriophage lambda head decoration protein D